LEGRERRREGEMISKSGGKKPDVTTNRKE
jgi:hypothetical protein